MPSTWNYWSKHVFGYVEEITPVNEYYVAVRKIQYHIDEGYSDSQISRIWNQGNPSPCKSGTNKQGVAYDSCAYEKKVLAMLR
jgi:hypothetical protein